MELLLYMLVGLVISIILIQINKYVCVNGVSEFNIRDWVFIGICSIFIPFGVTVIFIIISLWLYDDVLKCDTWGIKHILTKKRKYFWSKK